VEFWPQSVENRAALRTAFGVLIAVLISFAFHLQTPYWSGMSVIVVANLYTGSIIDKAMLRIIGTIAGAFLGLSIAGMVANSFILYLICCFLIIAVAVYYYSLSSYAYAYLLGALCAFLVISQIAFNPQNAFFVAIWRPVEIAIGVLVSAVCAYAIFPNHLKDNIVIQVHDIYAEFSVEFNLLLENLKGGDVSFDRVEQGNLGIKRKIRKAVELIGAMNRELGVRAERVDILRALLDSFSNLAKQLQYLIISLPQQNDLSEMKLLPVESVFAAIQQDIISLQMAFTTQSPSTIVLQTQKAIDALEKMVNEQRKQLSKRDFIYSFIYFLRQVNQSFILMQSLLVGESIKSGPKFQLINRKERLRNDNDLIKHSIKAGLSVLLALSFWFVSNWPGGLNGIISSLIISIRKNLYDMTNIGVFRLAGCFLGGGIALLSLFIIEMNLYNLIWVLFLSIWGFTYFMFRWPKYSYIGLQANIALVITLAQEGGPPVLLDPPLERLGGIVIGILASFIVANILWRSDVWTILGRYLDKLHNCLTFNLNQVLLGSGEQMRLHDLANLFWLSRGLIESLSDEVLSASKRSKLTGLAQRFESLVNIQATLSHILVAIDIERANCSAELFHLNLPFYAKNLVTIFERHDKDGGQGLSQQLQDFLLGIDKNPAYFKMVDSEFHNLVAYVNALIQLGMRVE